MLRPLIAVGASAGGGYIAAGPAAATASAAPTAVRKVVVPAVLTARLAAPVSLTVPWRRDVASGGRTSRPTFRVNAKRHGLPV